MRGMDGGKLSEVNAKTKSRRQNELVGKFKIAAIDLVSNRGAGYGVHVHSNRNYKGDGEIWCGLPLEGASRRDCWMRSGGHSF